MTKKTLTIYEAAEMMGITPQHLRASLRLNKYPLWGTAVPSASGKRFKYTIHAAPFLKYIEGGWSPEEANKGGLII